MYNNVRMTVLGNFFLVYKLKKTNLENVCILANVRYAL